MCFLSEIKKLNIDYEENASAKSFTSFKAGGTVKVCVCPKNRDELITAVLCAKGSGERFLVLGRGSNTLFCDGTFDGAVILTNGLKDITITDDGERGVIEAGCGAPLTALSLRASESSLSGLEFAYGIPGSCGGAVYMNAGAYGGQMSDVVAETEYFDVKSEKIVTLKAEDHDFSYRHSVFTESKDDMIILSVKLSLRKGDMDSIKAKMQENRKARAEKQPLEYPSAGSVFKRHPKYFMGQIIEESGLKGFRIGDAAVSEKHAGFIVNLGCATADDIIAVIDHVSRTISERYGFVPEREIEIIE